MRTALRFTPVPLLLVLFLAPAHSLKVELPHPCTRVQPGLIDSFVGEHLF